MDIHIEHIFSFRLTIMSILMKRDTTSYNIYYGGVPKFDNKIKGAAYIPLFFCTWTRLSCLFGQEVLVILLLT